jgi:2-methylcitrate dehydratase PrpD
VSVALLDRTVGLAQFADERVGRDDVQAFMPRVRMVVHPAQTTRDALATRFSEVTITLKDGRRLQKRVTQAKGQPRNPLTEKELQMKFLDCAARVLPSDRASSLLAAISGLEAVSDVAAVTALMRVATPA